MNRSARQSFLGAKSDEIFSKARVGIVGLGGGGSHIVQQLAHVGLRNYAIYDPDCVDEEGTNLNRLIGATVEDVKNRTPKITISKRMIKGLVPNATILAHQSVWEDAPDDLACCDIVLGCLEKLSQRQAMEAFTRRHLIPYIDIGMDVNTVEGQPPRMSGQVILSMPGSACMTCMGFLNERDLAKEAAQYGDAGGRPQVVWPNAILAANAVGIAVDLLTDWTQGLRGSVYLMYTGNTGAFEPHPRMKFLPPKCDHYPPDQVGDPIGTRIGSA